MHLRALNPRTKAPLFLMGKSFSLWKLFCWCLSTHPAAPSYQAHNARHPGAAISARERIKNSKYSTYASTLNATFVPFVIDAYGWLGKPAAKLINTIEADAFHPRLGLPACTRITSSNFLWLLAVEWQRHNANIVYQWSSMIRRLRLRSATINLPLIVV